MTRLFSFLIYSFIYLCVGGSLIGHYLGVSPFACFSYEKKEVFINPFSDWSSLYQAFWYENWTVNSFRNLIIFFTFLFFYPIWIFMWFVLRHFVKKKGKKFQSFFIHPKTEIPILPADIVKTSTSRPKALKQSHGFGGSLLQMQNEPSSSVLSPEDTTVRQVKAPSTSEDVEEETKDEIRALGQEFGYDLFERVRLDDCTVPLVLATDTEALLLTFLEENREWIADEEIADEETEPTWFSANGLIGSPFYQMTKAAKNLKEKEPDSEVIPVVVLCDGVILNAQNLKETWEEKNGAVVVWKNGKADSLLSLSDFIASRADRAQ